MFFRWEKKKGVSALKLTIKQKAFADAYIELGNATQAAIKAGYSERTARFIGTENLTKPNIKNYIDERLKEIEDKRIADAKEVLEYLTEVLRGKSTSEVFVDGCRTLKRPDEKEKLKAAELLGKRYGLYTEKIEAEIDGEINIKVNYGD